MELPTPDPRVRMFRSDPEVDCFAVVTRRHVVVVDTFGTPGEAAQMLALLGDDLAGRSLLVVNTHGHFDHAWGNALFAPGGPHRPEVGQPHPGPGRQPRRQSPVGQPEVPRLGAATDGTTGADDQVQSTLAERIQHPVQLGGIQGAVGVHHHHDVGPRGQQPGVAGAAVTALRDVDDRHPVVPAGLH